MLKGWKLDKYDLPQNQPLIWQIKASDFTGKLIYSSEFDKAPQNENIVQRYIIEDNKTDNFTLPYRLVSKQEPLGTQEIRIEFCAKRGRYTMYFDVLETVKSDLCVVELNGREIGTMAIPYAGNIDIDGRYKDINTKYLPDDFAIGKGLSDKYDLENRYEKLTHNLRVFRFEIPFVCTQDGQQSVSFYNEKARLNDTMNTFIGDGFRPVCLSFVQNINKPMGLDNLWAKHSGRALIDLWGWMSMTSFEHPANEVTQPSRQIMRGIIESFKWGANNLEFLPVNADGVALDLDGEEPWVGQEAYKQSKDKTWTGKEVEDLLALAHEHGMLCEFFIYCLHGAGFLATDMSYEAKINFLEKIMKRYGGCKTKGQVDGVIAEAWYPIDGPEYTAPMWKQNPTSFLLSSTNDGSQYDLINTGYSPAVHTYSAHWPGFDTQQTGYDHSYSTNGYPLEFYNKPEGTMYCYLQACGQTKHPRKNFPRILEMPPYGITNRTVSPDWIVAQTHGFALRRLQNPNDNTSMALCWEADEETMAPEQARRYVYAASQDPICLSAAGQLKDMGEGGEIALKRATKHQHQLDNTRLRARHRYPANTYFAQNRFLQLLMVEEHEYAALQVDVNESATFYNIGTAITPVNGYAVTRFDDARYLQRETKVIESAGPVCVVEQNAELGSGFVSFHQKLTHTVYSEVPAIVTDIARRILPGQQDFVETYFDISRYDTVNGELMPKGQEYESTQLTYVIEDSQKVLPTLCLHFIPSDVSCVKVKYQQGNALYFGQDLKTAHNLQVIGMLKMGVFADLSTEEMIETVKNTSISVTLKDDTAVINTEISGQKCICIENPDEAPYFVKENDWWHFKGATPSEQYYGKDYVRVYSSKQHPAEISRYGYLTGGIRPAYGCQNILTFNNLRQTQNGVKFTVRCATPNPMLCAPAILCNQDIKSVEINSKQWQYHDKRNIRLPAYEGEYIINVVYGESEEPYLVKTHATVTNAVWQNGTLTFNAKNPHWVNKDPINEYTAYIEHKGYVLDSVNNAKILIAEEDNTTIAIRTGEVSLKFTKK